MDRDLAAALIELEDAADEDDPIEDPVATPLGYTTDTYLLLAIVDALMGVQAAVIAAAGADPPQVKPMPRPSTAIDLLREERRLESLQQLIDLFTPRDPDEDGGAVDGG